MGYERKLLNNNNYFFIVKTTRSNLSLDYYISRINFNDYFIYKQTGKQKEVSKEDFLKFNYSGYIFFNKIIYDNKELQQSLEYLWSLGITIMYLDKPLPRLSDLKKIKIIDA